MVFRKFSLRLFQLQALAEAKTTPSKTSVAATYHSWYVKIRVVVKRRATGGALDPYSMSQSSCWYRGSSGLTMAEASDFRAASGAQASSSHKASCKTDWIREEFLTQMITGRAEHRRWLRQRLEAQPVLQGEAKRGAHCGRAEASRCHQEGLWHSSGACANMHSGLFLFHLGSCLFNLRFLPDWCLGP